MSRVSASLLERLLADGSVPATRLSGRDMTALVSLFETGALERARQGAGRVILVRQREVVEALARRLYPMGLAQALAPDDAVHPRAGAIAAVRDAKHSRRAAVEPILLRAFRPTPLHGEHGATIDLFGLTTQAGVVALTLSADRTWRLAGRLAVVENLELFYALERVVPEADAALYAGGRLSARVLEWLGSEAMRGAHVIHVGDYDPVGLCEYLRVKQACGERATLHIPANLPTLMRQFGKPALLRGRQATLLRALRAEDDAAVRAVVAHMDETGCGLEQEGLLIV